MSVRANKDTFESEINEAGKLVIADFYSDSCVPCKRMSPLLAETKEKCIMTITVAGNKKDVAEGLTVAQLVIDENVETPQYVTVTINDEFVESGAFESTVLKDGDVVEFLYFMGGGQ